MFRVVYFLNCFVLEDMGASESVPIPGGGSEGYHILRVSILSGNFAKSISLGTAIYRWHLSSSIIPVL